MSNPHSQPVIKIFRSDSDEMMQSEMLDSTSSHSSFSSEPPIPSSATLVHPSFSGSVSLDPPDYLEQPSENRAHIASPIFSSPKRTGAIGSLDYEPSPSEEPRKYAFFDSQTSTGLSPVLLSVIAYFFCWLGALILIAFEKKNVFVIFNAWQAFITGTFAFVIQFLFIWSSTMYTLLWIVYLIWEMCMIGLLIRNAPSQRLIKMPVIGDWCEHRAINKVQLASSESLSYQRWA